jgi:hypothetical protein
MKTNLKSWLAVVGSSTLVLITGCSSMQAPAKTSIAVSNEAMSSAAGAGGAEFAPVEMDSARQKLALSNKAMAAKDYTLAKELATQAQADANLAQGKANSSKAQLAANALQDDLRVLREELDRNSK